MRSSPIESLAVRASKHRSLVTFSNSEIDRPRSSRDERDNRGLVALPKNVQRAVTPFETQILDVGSAGFRYSKPI
jgi:hypothetical protein